MALPPTVSEPPKAALHTPERLAGAATNPGALVAIA